MNNGSEVAALQRLVERLRERIAFVEGSTFWRLRSLYIGARARFGSVPLDDAPAIPAREFAEVMDVLDAYTRWLLANEPRPADLTRMRELSALLVDAPTIAVIVDDVPGGAATAAAVASVESQAYGATRLVRTSTTGTGGSHESRLNAALAGCDAEVIGVCAEGYRLTPQATFEVALAFCDDPESLAVYGDRDVVSPNGTRSDPTFAPDWSPETFRSSMYTGPVVFFRREAVARAGGFAEGFGDALHYDLALRVFDDTSRVTHRASILSQRLATVGPSRAPGAPLGSARALSRALERRATPGTVVATECPDVHVIRYAREHTPSVDVIIPTRDLASKLDRCLQSVYERTSGLDVRVTVVDNGSVEPQTATLLARYTQEKDGKFRVIRIDEPFNFSRLINAAARECDRAYLLLLNNDAAFVSSDGIAAMCEYAACPSIGAVGARLLYADGTLQHAGVVIGTGGLAGHVYRGISRSRANRIPDVAGVRNYAAVTAAALMVRRGVFAAAGGFDEGLAVEFNDIDFCLKLRSLGLRNVYLPHVELCHDESSTRGVTKVASPSVVRERARFRERWRSDAFLDPYYNVHLTRADESVTPTTA